MIPLTYLIWLLVTVSFMCLIRETRWFTVNLCEVILIAPPIEDMQAIEDVPTKENITAFHWVFPSLKLDTILKTAKLNYRPPEYYDFTNGFASVWFNEFDNAIAHGGGHYWLKNYLDNAKKSCFAMPDKGCKDFWARYIKEAKPGTPGKPLYYDHFTIPKYNPVCGKPDCLSYGGNGFGEIDYHHDVLCGSGWLRSHKEKYPDGLPEQTIERKVR